MNVSDGFETLLSAQRRAMMRDTPTSASEAASEKSMLRMAELIEMQSWSPAMRIFVALGRSRPGPSRYRTGRNHADHRVQRQTCLLRQARRSYERSIAADGHTFFFDLDDGRVIDGATGRNSARWLNHSCTPNCEADQQGSEPMQRLSAISRPWVCRCPRSRLLFLYFELGRGLHFCWATGPA